MAESDEWRAVSCHPYGDRRRIIFTVQRTPETDAMTDEQLIARHKPWIEKIEAEEQRRRSERHLHVVDDPE